jgi:hypothetical protein
MSPSVAALDTAQGHSDGLDKKVQTVAKDADQERLILNTIRTLAADLCQQVSGPFVAHGRRSVLNSASSSKEVTPVPSWALPPSVLLCGSTRCPTTHPTLNGLRGTVSHPPPSFAVQSYTISPCQIVRSGFVLSAGHACLLQYLYLHFTGYSAWTMDQIRQYHAPVQSGSMAAGHPEIEYPGVEVTTGPLGQGIANAVGLAVAGKHVAGTYNKPGYDLVPGKVFAFTGDGCLQEGVGQEGESSRGSLILTFIHWLMISW